MELPVVQPSSSRPDVAIAVGSIPAAGSPVPALRLWGIRRSITLAVVAALLLAGAMVAAALWYVGWPSIKRDATVTPATLFDLLKLVFAVVAGIGGVAALVVAYRRQRVAEHTSALAEFAHQLAHAADLRAEATKVLAEAADERAKIETDRNGVRLLNERFAKASEQLGSEKAAVRLAGVYAMAGLADDWREGRQTCIDVLCAYLRMPYVPPPEASSEAPTQAGDEGSTAAAEAARLAREEREVRHTVIRLIGRHLRLAEEDPASWRGLDFDFTGAVFDGGDFSAAAFSGQASFVGATFCSGSVSFAEASFSGRVSFHGAMFSGGRVSFVGASFIGGKVFFDKATFGGADVHFYRANFNGAEVSFEEATVSGGALLFNRASFSGGEVSFFQGAFSGGKTSFSVATFSGGSVIFEQAIFSGGELRVAGATFNGGKASFDDVTFSGAEVHFYRPTFSLGKVTFDGARFSGGKVLFERPTFSGGEVSFDGATGRVLPQFDDWPGGSPLDGLFPWKA